MRPTPIHPNENALVDWFAAHERSPRAGRLPSLDPEATYFLNVLWPVSLPYYSPLNPVFLAQCAGLEALDKHPHWFVRDGLVPLLWFFEQHPSPRKLRSRLWVHEELGRWVPPAWRGHCGTYRLETTPGRERAAARGLLLTGIMMDSYCPLSRLDAHLDSIVARYGRRLDRMELALFAPACFGQRGETPAHEFHAEFMLRLCRKLGSSVRALSWARLEATESWEGFDVIDLTDRHLCADSYLLHLAVSRGANPRFEGQGQSGGDFVALSPLHGFRMHHSLGRLPTRADKPARLQEAMRSPANRRFPWPEWFARWTEQNA
jgi:hypothetical protein